MSVRIIVDSTADLTPAVKERVKIVPLTVHFGEEEYLDGVTMDYVQFYDKLVSCDALPTTSQPNPAAFEETYKEVVAAGDSAVVITIASKLSGTCQSATIAAADYDNVYVVDGQTAAIGTGILADFALQLADAGMSAKEIAEKLVVEREKVRIVALIDTLEFLQRGGRISKTVALAGSMLSIKPVITVKDGLIEMAAKVRGMKQGFKQIGVETEKMGEVDFTKPLMLGFTGKTSENLDKYEESFADLWKKDGSEYGTAAIGSAIGTHIGPGAVATAFFLK
ncbi:MAG: DegV family protein [Tyzzerella sp.]|nr:DegV family protein [Tyzzerella sp.]